MSSHRTLIRRALQVKLPMLQESIMHFFFHFSDDEGAVLFYGKNVRGFTMEALEKSGCYQAGLNIFDSMNLGLQAKLEIMRRYIRIWVHL